MDGAAPAKLNPENYRDWSAYVNLISDHLSRGVGTRGYSSYMPLGPSCQLLCALLDSRPI